jgi:hypothetical protein
MTDQDQIPAPYQPAEESPRGVDPAPAARLDPARPDPVPAPSPTPGRARRRNLRVAALGTIVAGGLAAAAVIGPLAADAASPNPAASTAPTASGNPPANGDVDRGGGPGKDGDHRGPGGFGHNEAVSDTSVAAGAIGISEADLLTALRNGQTIADVAKAHNVDVQKVIDALVQDGLDELAAQVKAGRLTQAQADSMKAEVTQRATDQVNGTFMGGRHH